MCIRMKGGGGHCECATEKVGFCPLCQHLEGDLGEEEREERRGWEEEAGPKRTQQWQ